MRCLFPEMVLPQCAHEVLLTSMGRRGGVGKLSEEERNEVHGSQAYVHRVESGFSKLDAESKGTGCLSGTWDGEVDCIVFDCKERSGDKFEKSFPGYDWEAMDGDVEL